MPSPFFSLAGLLPNSQNLVFSFCKQRKRPYQWLRAQDPSEKNGFLMAHNNKGGLEINCGEGEEEEN